MFCSSDNQPSLLAVLCCKASEIALALHGRMLSSVPESDLEGLDSSMTDLCNTPALGQTCGKAAAAAHVDGGQAASTCSEEQAVAEIPAAPATDKAAAAAAAGQEAETGGIKAFRATYGLGDEDGAVEEHAEIDEVEVVLVEKQDVQKFELQQQQQQQEAGSKHQQEEADSQQQQIDAVEEQQIQQKQGHLQQQQQNGLHHTIIPQYQQQQQPQLEQAEPCSSPWLLTPSPPTSQTPEELLMAAGDEPAAAAVVVVQGLSGSAGEGGQQAATVKGSPEGNSVIGGKAQCVMGAASEDEWAAVSRQRMLDLAGAQSQQQLQVSEAPL